jgi:hypothetical protein
MIIFELKFADPIFMNRVFHATAALTSPPHSAVSSENILVHCKPFYYFVHFIPGVKYSKNYILVELKVVIDVFVGLVPMYH